MLYCTADKEVHYVIERREMMKKLEKAHLLPGQRVVLHVEMRGCEPGLKICTVLTVQKGMFSVIETDSANGLAEVFSHGASWEDGTYWYQYVNQKRKHVHESVVKLEILRGKQIIVRSFIED
ncbi:MAG: hypothetical protein WCS97_01750 [Candidatus Paceibacterota bacterium]|jgi:hypothetical protein